MAAVLFVGLGAGALSPTLALPEIVYMLGLAIFVYTIGLASGPAFVASLRRDGLRHNALALGVLGGALLLTLLAQRLLGIGAPLASGLFAGALTNTPALAGAIETLKQSAHPGALAEPVVAYSITYPMGVIGVVLAIRLAFMIWKPDLAAEARTLGELGAANEPLTSCTIEVEQPLGGLTLDELKRGLGWRVIFGRLKRAGKFQLCDGETRLEQGDQVVAVGTEAALERVARRLGRRGADPIDFDRSEFDMRRIFVSDPGGGRHPLEGPRRPGALRRGDHAGAARRRRPAAGRPDAARAGRPGAGAGAGEAAPAR